MKRAVRERETPWWNGEKFLDTEANLVAHIADLLSRGGTKLLLKKVGGTNDQVSVG